MYFISVFIKQLLVKISSQLKEGRADEGWSSFLKVDSSVCETEKKL